MGKSINPKNLKLGGGNKKQSRRNTPPRVVDKNYGPLRRTITLTRLYEIWNEEDKQAREESGDRLGILTTGVIDEEHQHFIITIRKKNGLEEFL